MVRIAVDLMGSDSSPQEIFEAIIAVSKELSKDDNLVVIAQHSILSALRADFGPLVSNFEFITTEDAIEMDESPLFAVRRKKDSSMSAGIRLLKEKAIDAFVSTGNTGALVALATLHLPPLPGVERPALLVMMPTEKGKVVVLDVGANITPKPQHLFSYAVMGAFYHVAMLEGKKPRIGLLNIGVEEQKGTHELKETYQLLQKTFGEYFLGNIEGREVFQGKIDILVTDGFTGNVFLKTSEGISVFLAEYLQKHFGLPEVVSHLHQQFNYSEYPGAFLCGVEGIIVKCHGFSNKQALINGIRHAHALASKDILGKLKSSLE